MQSSLIYKRGESYAPFITSHSQNPYSATMKIRQNVKQISLSDIFNYQSTEDRYNGKQFLRDQAITDWAIK